MFHGAGCRRKAATAFELLQACLLASVGFSVGAGQHAGRLQARMWLGGQAHWLQCILGFHMVMRRSEIAPYMAFVLDGVLLGLWQGCSGLCCGHSSGNQRKPYFKRFSCKSESMLACVCCAMPAAADLICSTCHVGGLMLAFRPTQLGPDVPA
jgi:hypothetical protein